MGKIKYLSREEIKEIEIELLETVDSICEKHNIKYYICGGTLLGAVRHKGFIPWDDDIDIFLPRQDYDKLLSLMKSSEKVDWISVMDGNIPEYYYPYAKIVNNRTIAKMDDNLTEHGIWVDVFPLDNLPNNVKKREKIVNKCFFYRALVISMTTDFSNPKNVKKIYLKKVLSLIANLIGKEKVKEKYCQFILSTQQYKESNYIACLCTPYGKKEIFERDELLEREKYIFENKNFYGPKSFDKYLSQLYGEYMKFPPEEERRTHKIKAWRI